MFRLDSPGNVDGNACDALARVDGVDAAGATRAGDTLRFALLPDRPTPYFDASLGMAHLLDVDPASPNAGLIVDSTLAASLGLSHIPGTTFLIDGSRPSAVAGTYDHPDDGRDSTLSGAAIGLAVGSEPFDSCWVRFWPPSDNPLELLGTVTIDVGGSNGATQWNPTLGRTLDPNAVFHSLPLVVLTSLAAIAAAALAFVGLRLRRLELASALHVGVSHSALAGISLAECAIWLIPASLFAATTLAFCAAWHNPDPPLAAWLAGARVVAAAMSAWILTIGLTAAMTNEAHLVRYFQQR
ncbi:hypothetical protein ET475_00550 [Microbacterium protaetiae]|uniref:Uncharacterized protein n=1 Tax=Microbacterium protaetiae TaxID=2509458 RepID=A0A4P6E980_9MICO|nr:hypothetical protein [Microbacterium protaetiae]QAY58640.1 hypothetical protein ET475_00550 [Microbacterium protaetiae]